MGSISGSPYFGSLPFGLGGRDLGIGFGAFGFRVQGLGIKVQALTIGR